MDSQLIQRTRYQLQARVRAAKTSPVLLFPNACRHLLAWIESSPFVRHLLETLREEADEYATKLRDDLAKWGTPKVKEIQGPIAPTTRKRAAALYLAALRLVAELEFDSRNTQQPYLVAFLVCGFDDERHELSSMVEALRDVAVQGPL